LVGCRRLERVRMFPGQSPRRQGSAYAAAAAAAPYLGYGQQAAAMQHGYDLHAG
jgi:hypothetical protein